MYIQIFTWEWTYYIFNSLIFRLQIMYRIPSLAAAQTLHPPDFEVVRFKRDIAADSAITGFTAVFGAFFAITARSSAAMAGPAAEPQRISLFAFANSCRIIEIIPNSWAKWELFACKLLVFPVPA